MHTINSDIRNRTFSGTEPFCQYTSLSIKFLKIIFLTILITALLACSRGKSNGGTVTEPNFKLSNDSYSTFGNTALEVGVPLGATIAVRIAGSVLDNDTPEPGGSLTVTGVTPGTGSVIMNADGSFDYLPAAGLLGVDTFSYEVSDGTDTASAEVTITLDNRVWYLDNTGAGTEGTSVAPFSTLLDAQQAAQSGDTIYIAGDNSGNGMDQGLSLVESGITVIGAGVPLVVNGITLAPSGIVPVVTNTAANIINLDSITNTYIAGVTLDAAVADAVLITNSSAITLQDMTIQNSGESAIEGEGAVIGLSLNNVSIVNSDLGDTSTSDDAIFLHPTTSVMLTMNGGLIDGVPGNLGDGIVLLNADKTAVVDMELTVQGASFSNISQDAIKVDNENGLVDVLIGAPLAEGNDFSAIGYRGIVIMTDGDPSLLRTNSVIVENNIIDSTHEAIQLRGIDDITQVTVTNNTMVSTATSAILTSAIDLQHDYGAQSQARISNNSLTGEAVSTSTGLRVRLFDGANLAMQANNNSLDTFDKAFALSVRETTGNNSILNATVTDNQLLNISSPDLAMRAVNYHTNSETCLDLRNNSAVADYQVEVPAGVFSLAINSQLINLVSGSISGSPVSCQLPVF